jgi:putative IMPACT (imprinted ancient) family translation regulator
LIHHDLTNVLLVVVRYFGGTLLGVSGLAHAYREAATDAIRNARVESRNIETKFEIDCTFAQLNNIMQMIRTGGFHHLDTKMAESCKIIISVRKSDTGKAEDSLSQYYGIHYRKL